MEGDNNKENNKEILTPAERLYRNHLKNVRAYRLKYPEKIKEKNKTYFNKLKTENGDMYKSILKRRRDYYLDVVKPKKLEEKNKKRKIEETNRGECELVEN
jgi:hypothetical protein